MPPTCVTCSELPRRRRLNICDLMLPTIGWTCAWRMNAPVTVLLSCCGVISVNARAAPPYDNNAHPRILLRAFWSTVSSLVDTVPYREIRIMQGRDNDNMKPSVATALTATLLGLDPGGPGDLGEAGDFALDVGGELLGRAGRDLESLSGERALHVRSSQHLDRFGVQPCYDGARGSRGHEQSEPRSDFEIRQPRLGHRRHVGQQARAPGHGHRERPHLPGLDLRPDVGDVGKHHRHLAAEQAGAPRPRALEEGVLDH